MIVSFEANHAVAGMLEEKPSVALDRVPAGHRRNEKAPYGNVAKQDWWEHWVVMTNEPKNAVLIAARKSVCKQVEMLHWDAWPDGTWKDKGKHRAATTRLLICRFHWKQNIGHLGHQVVVMGVHAHYRTMNMLFPESVNKKWWRDVKDLILKHKVNF